MKAQRIASSAGRQPALVPRALALLGVGLLGAVVNLPASAATLDRILETQRIRLGYLVDAPPFTYQTEAGAAEGYGVSLCEAIVDTIRTDIAAAAELVIDWVPVGTEARFDDVARENIDLLCTPAAVTRARREEVAFSIPVFGGGVRAFMSTSAPLSLREALSENPPVRPVWRGSPAAKTLQETVFGVVSDTTTETWLAGRLQAFQLDARVVPVPSYRAGVQALQDGEIDVFFGDLALVLGITEGAADARVSMLDRLFTHEQLGLVLARNDDDFRLVVDSALSELYASAAFEELYARWFGELDDRIETFFQWISIPDL